jgi:NAD(P)-dependent dehydrogenase (short-subunit alcohol dehydrogenase family)
MVPSEEHVPFVRCDVANEKRVCNRGAETHPVFERIDSAVNNGGVEGPPASHVDSPPAEDGDSVLAVNLPSTVAGS